MLPQWMTTGPAPMKEVKRINVVIARHQQQGAEFPPRNP